MAGEAADGDRAAASLAGDEADGDGGDGPAIDVDAVAGVEDGGLGVGGGVGLDLSGWSRGSAGRDGRDAGAGREDAAGEGRREGRDGFGPRRGEGGEGGAFVVGAEEEGGEEVLGGVSGGLLRSGRRERACVAEGWAAGTADVASPLVEILKWFRAPATRHREEWVVTPLSRC